MKSKGMSTRSEFASWIRSHSLTLVDLELDAVLLEAVSRPRKLDLKDVSGLPIAPDMFMLEEASLLLNGWWAGDDALRVVRRSGKRAGQTFLAGRQIGAAFETLERTAKGADTASQAGKTPKARDHFRAMGFADCSAESSYFVEIGAAIDLLKHEPLTEPVLNGNVLRSLNASARPTYEDLERTISVLDREFRELKLTINAAKVKQANRMLEALRALDNFAARKWGGTRTSRLDLYDTHVIHDPTLGEAKVPTREELETWIKAAAKAAAHK
jgi:hypothetical protein